MKLNYKELLDGSRRSVIEYTLKDLNETLTFFVPQFITVERNLLKQRIKNLTSDYTKADVIVIKKEHRWTPNTYQYSYNSNEKSYILKYFTGKPCVQETEFYQYLQASNPVKQLLTSEILETIVNNKRNPAVLDSIVTTIEIPSLEFLTGDYYFLSRFLQNNSYETNFKNLKILKDTLESCFKLLKPEDLKNYDISHYTDELLDNVDIYDYQQLGKTILINTIKNMKNHGIE